MAGQPSYDFVYVHTDIPEGMTIREWRAQRAAERAAEQQAARDARRRRSVRRRGLGGRRVARSRRVGSPRTLRSLAEEGVRVVLGPVRQP